MHATGAVLPTLAHIQANLDGDLSLGHLAERAGYSAFHFHRAFQAEVGETLKAYTLRLRLERAAFRLLLHGGSALEVAGDCGFEHPATFSRAFRRRFGTTPSDFRRRGRVAIDELAAGSVGQPMATPYTLSATRIVTLRDADLAFIRHVGPYEQADPGMFDELAAWHSRQGLGARPVFLGIGHDAPGTTALDRLRFDAAVLVPGPIRPIGRIAHQVLPGGTFAMTSHVGPLPSVAEAHRTVFGRLGAMPGIRIIGLPVVEVYHTTRVDTARSISNTDLYIPVERGTPWRPTTRASRSTRRRPTSSRSSSSPSD
jgi:AraC family transcriptional regulator